MTAVARFAADDADFQADLEQIELASSGRLCFAIRDLQSGALLARHADTPCKTASIIKLPILVHVALAVEEGTMNWHERLLLTDAEKVPGAGVLPQLTAGLALTLHDACMLMIIISDNTATNMVIERVGVAAVNQRMRELGLPITTLHRKVYAPDRDDDIYGEQSRQYGLGVTTPGEMLHLLERLAANELGNKATSAEILRFLEQQQYRDSAPRLLPSEWKYAGKTGAVDACRNDVALVTDTDHHRYALALFCQDLTRVLWTADNPGEVALSRLARRALAWDAER